MERLRDIDVAVGEDPAIERVLVFYDQAADVGAAERSWAAVREGITLGAEHCQVPVIVSSTLPELLDEDGAAGFIDAGVPAVAGLRTGLACAAALSVPPGDPARLRAMGSAAAARAADNGAGWMSEHEAKELLRAAGLPVVEGRLVSGEDDAAAALSELGGRVAVKLDGRSVRHKAELGALALDVSTELDARAAHRRLVALGVEGAGVLVERMAAPGAELFVAARADGVVPCLVVGAGGVWSEALADVAVVPLPASPERVERAIRGLRAAPLFAGGRGHPALDLAAAAALASAAGQILLDNGLELLELNPVLVHERGAVAVDALAAA